jgi:hypothetical protein
MFRSKLVISDNLEQILELLMQVELHYGKEENLHYTTAEKPVYAGLDG